MKRAYAVLDIRSADEDKRILEGVATTDGIDAYQSILEPEGAQYSLPIPVLYQHNAKQPIGHVTQAKVRGKGIDVKIQIASAGIAPWIDEAWSLIRHGLVRGLSVGFMPIEEVFDKTFNGFRYPKWKWHELSTVTIPANEAANITAIRSADEAILAGLGIRERTTVVRLKTNSSAPADLTRTEGKSMAKRTIREQITDFEHKRTANQVRMDAIMDAAGEETRSLNGDESEDYNNHKAENKQIDEHLARLKEHETEMLSRATVVTPPLQSTPNGNPQSEGVSIRRSEPITVRSNAPKGIAVARMAIAMVQAKGIRPFAADLAKRHWPDAPEVELLLRTGVDAGDTTTSGWASQLVPAAQQASGEFLEMLRAQTILGRIPGLRRVPFNIAVPIQTGGGSYTWVGEAIPKPVTSLTFSSITLRWAKAAGIIVITQELAKFSNPSAEAIIRDEMIAGLTRFLDAQFISGNAEVSNVSPAGILNGISAVSASGTTASAFRTDMNNMLNNFAANNVPLSSIVLIMSSTQAIALSLMVTDLGVPLFSSITAQGGTILGFPVIISEAVGTKIIALAANQILLAEDGGIMLDVSTEATVEMETTPAVGEQSPLSAITNLKSFWQNNLVGFRVEQFITWKAGRTAAVEYINGNAYVPS